MSEQVPSGYVWNCYTKSREGDGPLFVAHDDTVTARLDGYAIIPIEEHNAALARMARLEAALRIPEVWTEEERDGMVRAFAKANERHGHMETLFAVAAWLLRHRAAALADAPEEGGDD